MSDLKGYQLKGRRSPGAFLGALKTIFGLKADAKASQGSTFQPILISGPCRYTVSVKTDEDDGGELEYRGVVTDTVTGEVLYETLSRTTDDPWASPPDGYEDCSYADDNDGACRRDVVFDARTWLLAEYPEADNPRAYWDD